MAKITATFSNGSVASFFTEWASAFGPLGILLVAVGGFILGCIALIGVETARSKKAERQKIQTRKPEKSPNFGLVLRGGSTFNPGATREFSGIAASVLIWNTGDPSHIVDWVMTISVGDVTYAGQHSNINQNGITDAQTGRRIIEWEQTFEAQRKAIGGEPLECDVVFFFRAPLPELVGPLAVWRINFSDIYGNKCSAEYRPGGAITSRDLK